MLDLESRPIVQITKRLALDLDSNVLLLVLRADLKALAERGAGQPKNRNSSLFLLKRR